MGCRDVLPLAVGEIGHHAQHQCLYSVLHMMEAHAPIMAVQIVCATIVLLKLWLSLVSHDLTQVGRGKLGAPIRCLPKQTYFGEAFCVEKGNNPYLSHCFEVAQVLAKS